MMGCYVYIAIETPKAAFAKVGVTYKHPRSRVRELQTGNPYQLRLAAAINVEDRNAALEIEADVIELDRVFCEGNVPIKHRGEWILGHGNFDSQNWTEYLIDAALARGYPAEPMYEPELSGEQ